MPEREPKGFTEKLKENGKKVALLTAAIMGSIYLFLSVLG